MGNLERKVIRTTKDLFENPKYWGKWVAVSAEEELIKVVAYGKNLGRVIKKARERSAKIPALLYSPHPDEVFVGGASLFGSDKKSYRPAA